MPRYFFHYRDRGRLIRDAEGEVLNDRFAAEENAYSAVAEILREGLLGDNPILSDYSFEVFDEAGSPILSLPFSRALEPQIS